MKKILAMLLALMMLAASCAALADTNPDSISDEITSDNGVYQIAFVTDVGQLKDKSFNQGTWNGVKAYASENGKTYKYYQPSGGTNSTDDDRFAAMEAAVKGGAEVVVCAGFKQEAALKAAAEKYPEVKFIFIDGYPIGLDNVAPIAFCEEQSGYLAGYAVVSEGFTRLGFCGGGGGNNPACCRYGYGFAQGANDAAKEKGITVDLKYSWLYGAAFGASSELQTMASGWYEDGTEIIFACGGTMFNSITAAASANDGSVVGVDVDQSFDSDTVVTSALKGLVSATKWAIGKCYDGTFAEIGGIATSLGAKDDSVGLPTDTWSMMNYSVENYQDLLAKIKSGEFVVDSSLKENGTVVDAGLTNVNIEYVE